MSTQWHVMRSADVLHHRIAIELVKDGGAFSDHIADHRERIEDVQALLKTSKHQRWRHER